MAVMPLLIFWYLVWFDMQNARENGPWPLVWLIFFALILAFTGYSILRKYPVSVSKLRGYVENIARGEFPQEVELDTDGDDISAIEKYMNIVVSQLRKRAERAEEEKADVERQLWRVQKMESLGLLAGGVAHDFGNLMAGILAHVSFVKEALAEDQESARDSVDAIAQIARQGAELTEQMLVYAGRKRIPASRIDVSSLIREMQALFKVSLARGVRLEYNLVDGLPPIACEAARFRQIIMNLVINASDAMAGGSGVVSVVSGVRRFNAAELACMQPRINAGDGEYVFIEVSDNGCGMDADTSSRIFDPFFTTKKKGRGLGLPVVFGIIRACGGLIGVQSSSGQGACFMVVFPRADQGKVGLSPTSDPLPMPSATQPDLIG